MIREEKRDAHQKEVEKMSKPILISVFALVVISAGWGMVDAVHHSSHAFAEDTSHESPVNKKIHPSAFDDNDLPCYVGDKAWQHALRTIPTTIPSMENAMRP
jgi:hypothetical protein